MVRAATPVFSVLMLLMVLSGALGWNPAAHAQASPQSATSPVVVSLYEAIRLAEQNEPAYAMAVAERGSAQLDRSIARSALLPDVTYHNQYLYTQPNGLKNAAGQIGNQLAPRFIANNAIREYASQALVTETLAPAAFARWKQADATAIQAEAAQEIARRGLLAAVVGQYYGLLAAEERLKIAGRALNEAQSFAGLTRQLEHGREVAHADVVKADLQVQERQRYLEDAQLAADNARLEMGTLLFSDPRTNYRLKDDRDQMPPVPDRAAVEAAAQTNNPELRSALAALQAAGDNVQAARFAYLPDLSLNWTYGIDAPQFAANGPLIPETGGSGEVIGNRPQNLGYSAFVTLDFPVWDWFATHDRVKQSELRRTASKVALSYAQRQSVAQLDEFYREAETAGRQVASLEESVRTASDSLRLTNLRYKAGEGTALEVVDAQDTLILAEEARAGGVVRYRVALANLQTLTGSMP